MNSARDQLTRKHYDAIIIGSGPNGLAAAITLARRGKSVAVIEGQSTPGGGARSQELTLPGFVHDICSAIHPLGVSSPFFRDVPLSEYGLEWLHPKYPLAHPLDDGTAAILDRSIEVTATSLGSDGDNWRRLFEPLTNKAETLFAELLGPIKLIPRHPFLLAKFGLRAIRSAKGLSYSWFKHDHARALFAGLAGHSIMRLDQLLTSAVGIMLGVSAHWVGWPLPKGGSQQITNAMIEYLKTLGGEIVTNWQIKRLKELPEAKAYLFDVIPRNLARICAEDLPSRFRKQLNKFRHGPGVFKLDWALNGPIPWRAEACQGAGTVHLGGTFEEIAFSEREMWKGRVAKQPYVLAAQQSLFDDTRAPHGKHTGWAYCHVPANCTVDMTDAIESQMERFAPGFRDLIIARHVMTPQHFEQHNANYLGGDITGGIMDIWQAVARPTWRRVPYSTPNEKIYLCSASTPPGAGVHGMCGYHAAEAVLRKVLR